MIETQAGFKNESTYGTAVTVDRFTEINSVKVKRQMGTIEYTGMRASQRVQRSDRYVSYVRGAAGPIEFNPLSKGFGWWLVHMLGTSATSGPSGDGAYTHTGTVGSLTGDMFTFQWNAYDTTGTNRPMTGEGGKITKWKLGCDVEGLLVFTADLDFEDIKDATSLASASYPSSAELFSFVGAAATIGGTSWPLKDFSVEHDAGLNVDRRMIQGSALKLQPLESKASRDIKWSATADWDSLTQYNRFKAETAAGRVAQIIATFTAPTLIGGTTYPTVTVTLPAARFDENPEPDVDGSDIAESKLGGRVLYDGTNSPVTIAVVNADSTA